METAEGGGCCVRMRLNISLNPQSETVMFAPSWLHLQAEYKLLALNEAARTGVEMINCSLRSVLDD